MDTTSTYFVRDPNTPVRVNLCHDHVEIRREPARGSTDAERIPFASLHPDPVPLRKWQMGAVAVLLLPIVMLLVGMPGREMEITEIIFMQLFVWSIVVPLVWYFGLRIEYAVFMTKGGAVGIVVPRFGPDRHRFDEFVALLSAKIRAAQEADNTSRQQKPHLPGEHEGLVRADQFEGINKDASEAYSSIVATAVDVNETLSSLEQKYGAVLGSFSRSTLLRREEFCLFLGRLFVVHQAIFARGTRTLVELRQLVPQETRIGKFDDKKFAATFAASLVLFLAPPLVFGEAWMYAGIVAFSIVWIIYSIRSFFPQRDGIEVVAFRNKAGIPLVAITGRRNDVSFSKFCELVANEIQRANTERKTH